MDPILSVMLAIKNSWSLTETGVKNSDITFSTGWYDEGIAMPQVTVTPAGGVYSLQEVGPTPLYQMGDFISVNVWVRPDSSSNKSFGSAKHKEYTIRKEVERIIRSGSQVATGEFVFASRWRRLDELNKRPVILRSMIDITDNYFRAVYEGYS